LTYISSISENSLNDYRYPTDGVKNSLNLELGLPLSDSKYYKFDYKYQNYTPVKDNLTLKLSSQLGLIDTYDNSSTPFYKRYYGGGSSSLRGFDFNSLGPKYSDNNVKGGEVYLLGSSSIISPVSFIEDSDNMRIGAFVDIGSITESVSNFDLNDIRASSGIAFSWYTPIGPIGLNWTKPLISKTGDNLKTFSFNLGTTF